MSNRSATEDQQSNMIKDPDEWKTGDEEMTGAQRSYLQHWLMRQVRSLT